MNDRNISWILFRQLDHFGHEPEVIFLLGHWNNEGLGCTKRMAVPEIHEASHADSRLLRLRQARVVAIGVS